MNILYLMFTFKIGGIQKLLIDITNSLCQDKDNKVYLCIINKFYDEEYLEKVNKNVRIILLNREQSGKIFKYMYRFTKFVVENHIDIIHCNIENSVKFCILAKLIRPRIKIFLTVHDTNIFTTLKYHEVLIDRIMCRKIIAISDIVKKEILTREIPEKKVVKIYNAIDIKKYKIENKKIDTNHIVIGNIARLMPSKKGQDILIKAVGMLKHNHPDIICLFAGDVAHKESNILNELLDLCDTENVRDNIKFLGNVLDIKAFMKKIDIFVLPSVYEGFGIALIEAMAAGIPCIASNIDGPKEIIKDEEYGLLFESGNPSSLAEKIEYRIQNINVNEEIIYKYIMENYNIVSMMNKLVDLYKE